MEIHAHTRYFWLACPNPQSGFATIEIALCLALLTIAWPVAAQTITYVGVKRDQTNFSPSGLNIGRSGYWFPQFNSVRAVERRPTDENAVDALPVWAGPLNHTTSVFSPAFWTRSFSQDKGGVRSKGGQPGWSIFTLPDGQKGLSGSLVDPNTVNNRNNTVNRITLAEDGELPRSFLLHVIVDNTNGQHNPARLLRVRGARRGQPDVSCEPDATDFVFNGVADVYTFRFDDWEKGDFIKIAINGGPSAVAGAGIAGVLFDEIR